MIIYSIVTEDYSVFLCYTKKELFRWFKSPNWWVDGSFERIKISDRLLDSLLKTGTPVYVFEDATGAWLYKIQKHDKRR